MHLERPQRTGQESRGRIHVAIRRQPSRGPLSLSVDISLRTVFPMSKRVFPMDRKKTSESIDLRLGVSSSHSMKRNWRNVRTRQSSGIRCHCRMTFNASTWAVLGTSVCYWCLRRLSKGIPTDVTDFLKYMNHRTGAVFIAFAAYTNEDGEQTYARWDSDGLPGFICSNYFLDMRRAESIFSKPDRSISRAPITSSMCGKSSTSVRSHPII